ncbi:MAG: tyrosine--tRNA ligase [Thermodesulfobacteriota bacterium]
MDNVLDVLEERGFVYQMTADGPSEKESLRALLRGKATCYIGFDPTSSSLHVGSLVPIMALVHMQRYGHRPIALIGGGTGLIGDPSGKTEMRKILSLEEIRQNALGIRRQLKQFLDFEEGRALLLNNDQWLCPLNYIEFLRDIGVHFSVNRMLAAESIRKGLERGLSFIEFNYMLLQAYDFWHLFRNYDCTVQMGGSDQWGNIVAGIDLIRKLEGAQAYGITFPLLETSSGRKMGKTERGTVWLDAERTSPYEYYQFWINTEDSDVARFLALFTLLPMEEVRGVEGLQGADLNPAKAVLAYEATRIAHGREAALEAHRASAIFGSKEIPLGLLPSSPVPRRMDHADLSSIPTTMVEEQRLREGVPAPVLLVETGLCKSLGEARRLIAQGGAYCNERRIGSHEERLGKGDLLGGGILLRKGKKVYHRVVAGPQGDPA